jgi:hypothetical protein
MNRRAIKSILRSKINSWLESIEDESVRKLVSENIIVTGGAIVSLLLKEGVKDYDIYFKTKETVVAVCKYYIQKYKENGGDGEIMLAYDEDSYKNLNSKRLEEQAKEIKPDDLRVRLYIRSRGTAGILPSEPLEDIINAETDEQVEDKKYEPIFFSSNAITLSGKIQLVIRFFGEPDEIHKNYDFVHCTSYWTSWNSELVLRPEAVEAILMKQLIYVGSKYPVCPIIRTKKFISRGWVCNAGQFLKMIFQCGELDLTDISVLEDQLVGVDSAYFDNLITALSDHTDKNPDFKLDYGYLAGIIDRIF